MVRRTKEEAQETRAQIIEAAEKAFYKRGVARTTLADIAELAGVTRGAIYWHFNNKAELVQALNAKGIPVVDSTPALEAQVERHVQIYPPTSDGHPTALGHKAIAESVLTALKKRPANAAVSAAQ